MAKPVAYRVFTPPDAREELKRKIDEAPAEHADAILSGYRLLEQAHESGTLELLRGALAAQDSIINHVVGMVSQPEMVNGLRSRYQLFGLDYEIAPQRPLPLPGGRVFPSIDVLASRVKLHAKALHEGDILGFMDELSKQRQGFHPVDECTMRRIAGAGDGRLQAHVEADCTLEWITLKDKGANRAG